LSRPEQTRPFKVAIVGGGHIADQNHIPILKQLSDRVSVVAICSRDANKARILADKYDIPLAFNNLPDLFSGDHKPDIVFNCTANNLHYPFTIQALENDCHVFCEKPPAMNAKEAREMAHVAKEKGKTLAYNFQRRHTPQFSLLQKCLREGSLGDVYHIKATYLRRRGIPGWGNFTNKSIQGGGALIDLGVHILDLALSLLDYHIPDKILGNTYDFIGKAGGKGLKGTWDPAKFEVEDASFAYLSFPNNASIILSSSFALNRKDEETINLEISGTKAGATLNPVELFTEIAGELANIQFPHLTPTNPQLENTIAFLDACEGKASNICTAEQGAILQEIVERIYKSAGH
jgi:predicted dehydrogenase